MINLYDFCSENRSGLTQPSQLDRYTIASNGHMLIATIGLSDYQPYDGHNAETILNIIKKIDELSFKDKPAIVWPNADQCSTCKGGGTAKKTVCPECDGEGEVSFSNYFNTYFIDCQTCDADGDVIAIHPSATCPDCHGNGTVFKRHVSVDIYGVKVNPNYLRMIIDQPGIEFCPSPDDFKLFYKFGDYAGVIMGMQV